MKASAFHFSHSAATSASSSRLNTFPVGLFGVLMTMALVRPEKARSSSAGSKVQSGSRRRTKRGTAPQRIASGP